MPPHTTWFDYLPGYETLRANLQRLLGRGWTWQMFQTTHFQLDHVLGGVLVVLFLVLGAARYAVSVSASGDAGLVDMLRAKP